MSQNVKKTSFQRKSIEFFIKKKKNNSKQMTKELQSPTDLKNDKLTKNVCLPCPKTVNVGARMIIF